VSATDDLQVPHMKFGIKAVELAHQYLRAALLLVALGLAAIAGHRSPRPMATDWAGEPLLKRSNCAPERSSMASLALPSGRPYVIGALRDRASPSAARLRCQRPLSCRPVMLVMIGTELASNHQVDVGQSAEMSSERPQDDGVMLVHAKTSADANACRREHHPRRSDLTKLHAVDSSSRQRCHSSNLCSVTSRVKHLRAAGMRRGQGDHRGQPCRPAEGVGRACSRSCRPSPPFGGGELALALHPLGRPLQERRRARRAASPLSGSRRSGGRYSPTRSRDHQAPVRRRSAGVVKR
jgi:hypothetical protein